MTEPVLMWDTDSRGVATIRINRPDVNNAYNGDMIDAFIEAGAQLGSDPGVRIIVIRGNGRHFQAGADLNWISEMSTLSEADNIDASRRTTNAVRFLDACPKPTMALVHGGCFGGGTGIIAACDIVIASADAFFSIAEVRWGLAAGIIIPQLTTAIGARNVRRFALSGERFDALQAKDIGLVHEVCAEGTLDDAATPIIDNILKNSPTAISETKRILFDTANLNVDDVLAEKLWQGHGTTRMSADAAEGLASFREKREANWYPGATE
ncbi:MAG: enoyl-CoA hydratase [Rhodospirillaceae bacterium]|jgi:methylglutaconyl-CoA hydratase|nr:enoyl-CoA hydratase [Rhodospirillaceae bacterium]MBT5299139.1 enoyl-CoA hydratase [Rhodospirillaceae bacterium]MBT5515369.1 enoyl-CoA hydratase [Rhodospirillaceae bacterium]MBT6084711.1 enoyl-CoA hydratase [Rhodospirillaceae bacterium]MBT6884923.1 enoyl-CoA hydratase [Rhodospirillaceae bacterium]